MKKTLKVIKLGRTSHTRGKRANRTLDDREPRTTSRFSAIEESPRNRKYLASGTGSVAVAEERIMAPIRVGFPV